MIYMLLRITFEHMKQSKFLDLLEPLRPKLFGFAFRMLRDQDAAKDALQELSMRLWTKRKELKTNKNIPAYCFRTMNNICIDELRRLQKTEASIPKSREPFYTSPDISIEHKELINHIRQAVDLLPEKQKAIIELHDFQDFNYTEIAEILDMEVNAIRVNLSRARAKIVAQFRKEEIYD